MSEIAVAEDRPEILFGGEESAGMKRGSFIFIFHVNGSSCFKEAEDRFGSSGDTGIVERSSTIDILSVDEFSALFVLSVLRVP